MVGLLDQEPAELVRTAARGYAENREEWRLGVCGLGAPIFNARGTPVAAVGMSVPSIRFGRVHSRALAAQLVACARDASIALGLRLAGAESPRPVPGQDSRRHDEKTA